MEKKIFKHKNLKMLNLHQNDTVNQIFQLKFYFFFENFLSFAAN
jgi:hypothetical protein